MGKGKHRHNKGKPQRAAARAEPNLLPIAAAGAYAGRIRSADPETGAEDTLAFSLPPGLTPMDIHVDDVGSVL